jgi:hypothetical protein
MWLIDQDDGALKDVILVRVMEVSGEVSSWRSAVMPSCMSSVTATPSPPFG